MRTFTIELDRPIEVALYRGLSPRAFERATRYGVGPVEAPFAPGAPSEYELKTSCLEPDLHVALHGDRVVEHCESGSSEGGSVWVSWSTSPMVAAWFALAGGSQRSGFVAQARLQLTHQYVIEALDRPCDAVFRDERGRTAVATARLRDLRLDALQPERMRRLREQAKNEQEMLVRGHIEAWELQIFRATRRAA